jgi:SdrD B-like domain
MKKSLRLRIVKAIIPCFSLLFTASLFNHSLAQNVTGIVFRDFNANGLQSATNPIEPGVPGVTVKVFKADGTQVGANLTTALDGTYSVSVGNTNDFRVEFSNFPIAFFSGSKGTGSNTSTQFVKGGATANLGINYPSDYCGIANPQLVTPCYINGTPITGGNGANEPAIVSVPYTPTGNGSTLPAGTNPSENKYLAKGVEVGATWGMAYQRSSKFIFTSALLKRHSGLGTGGPGAIYKIDNSTSTPITSLFVDLNTDLGFSAGDNPRDPSSAADSIPRFKNQPSRDEKAFGLVGKMSLGDLDISDDEKTLWVINTFDKKLYELKIGSPAVKPTTATAHILPDPGCVNGVFRPWATKFWRGKIYVGGVCTAENAGGTAADLKAYIYSFTPGDADPNNFKEVYNFKLDYPRGSTSLDGTKSTSAAWKPWIAKWSDITNPLPSAAAYNQTICPQPMLSDIEFDVDGSMILGFMDRAGHQLGSNNYSTLLTDFKVGSTTVRNLYEGISAGDLLRVGLNADGLTYTLEKDATVNGVISGGKGQSPSQGPGTGEFYWQDMYKQSADKNLPNLASGGHQEISLGGIALFPGKNEVVETVFDPVNAFRAGGVRWFDNTTGQAPRAYEIFGQDAGGLGVTFGKANGLGDLELLCASQPIEVGNRLWNDIDKDGIQDAGEPVLTGVKVQLFKNGVQVGTDITTDAVTGEYYFTDLIPNQTDYEIRVPNVNGGAKQTPLANLTPTTVNAGTNDEIDSDATVTGTYASIAFTTGNAGENNHTLDFGFKCLTPTAKPGGLDVTVCNGNATFDLPDAKTGVEAETWTVVSSETGATASINATSGAVTGMTVAGDYVFKLTNNATGCFETVSITVAPMIAAGADKTICSPATTSSLNAPSLNQTWTVITKQTGTNPVVATNGNVTGLTADGPYTFRLTDKNNLCFEDVQITRTVAPNAGADISSCTTTAKLVAAVGTETWSIVISPANPSPATIDANGNISGMVNNGDYQFELKSTATGCSDIVKVTKTTGVDVTAENLSVCTDGIIQLKATSTTTSGVSYFWKGPTGTGFTSNQQNPAIANASASNAGIYTVTASLGGCSAMATSKVTFNEITVGVIAGVPDACVGQNLRVYDAADRTKPGTPQVMSYFWSGPNGTNTYTSNTSEIIIPTAADLSQAGEYMLVEKFTNGCTVTNMLTLTVKRCQSLGDLVWKDVNNDGLNNNGELGISNVPVKLFDALAPTVPIASSTTDANGKYLFRDLNPGSYIVEIDAPVGYKSSTGKNGSATGIFEPGVNPFDDTFTNYNDQDHGSNGTGQLLRSGIVVLTYNGEPETDGETTPADSATNKSSNRTIDFGIFQPAKIGDFVWSDTNKNGIQETGELGVSGVIVWLYAGTGTTPIAKDTTGSDGKYLFDNLTPGTYTVEFVKSSIGAGNGFAPKNNATTTTNKDSDADLTTGKSAPITLSAGESNLTIDAGIVGNCVQTAIGTISVPSLCVGQSLTMNATSSDPLATYAWSTNATTAFTSTSKDVTLPSLTTNNSGTYTVLITNSNLCTSALTANVFVNPIPTITVNSASFCSGATGTLTASGASSYSWSGPGGAFTATTATVSVTQQGVYTVTGNSIGCTAKATTSVTVFPKTVLTATGAAICLGGNGTISVLPAGLKYAWTGPAPFSSTLQTPTITNAADGDKGTYTVTVTDGNTCISTATVAVTVGSVLTVTPTSNSPVCVGTRLDLSITGGTVATYLWTSPKGATSNVQNPFTLNASLEDKGVWTVAVQNTDGCKGSGSVTVDVKPALTGVTATANVPGCTGDNITLTSSPSGAKSYEWSGSPSFASSVQNPTIVKPSADNYTFTVKITNVDGCTALATASTAIYTAPAATASSNSPVCFGNTINLGVTTSGTKFSWTGPNGFTNSTQTPSILNASLLKDGTYTVVVTNANSCNATSTVRVIVNSQLNGGNDLSICSPVSTAQLSVIAGATWSPDVTNPAIATVDANGKVSGMTVNGTYAFTITDAGGCKDIVKVFRNEKLDAGNDVVICSPTSTAKLLKTNTGQTWKYFANGQTQPTPTIDANGNVEGVTEDGSYLFILEQTGGTTYCADTLAVIRKPAPMAGGDQTVASGGGICFPQSTAKLQAANTTLKQAWAVSSNSPGFGTVVIDANGNVSKMNAVGIYTFVLTQAECTDSVKVEIIAKPIAGPDVEICSDIKTVKLPNAPTNMTWSSISTNPAGTLINVTTGEVTGLTTAGEYKFILKNAGGCTDTVSVKTKAIPIFDVNAVQATCTIGAANPDAKLIVSSTDATATYDFNEGITYTGTKTFATGTTITTPVTGLTNPTVDRSYTVRVFNSTGCYTDKTVILKPRVCECKPDVCVPYAVRKTK